MFGIFVHHSTRPTYDVSMNLFCWPPSVDIFNILPGFLWQPLLNIFKKRSDFFDFIVDLFLNLSRACFSRTIILFWKSVNGSSKTKLSVPFVRAY